MSLHDVLQRRGYAFRQHLEEEGWTRRKLTVIDLDDAQRAALEHGGIDGLKGVLDAQGLWSFPALDIEKPLPVQSDVVLAEGGQTLSTVIAPTADSTSKQMAHAFVDAVSERFGLKLALLDEAHADLGLLKSQHIVLFGGSHENRFAMEMALRYQTGFVDAVVPGDTGWVVTVHTGLDASAKNIAQIAASPLRCKEAMACLLDYIARDGNRVVLKRVHCISPGREMREHFPSWEAYTSSLPGRLPQLSEQTTKAPQAPVGLADVLSAGLHSGGPDINFYNRAPFDIAVQTAQYYQLSGDTRALQLFRELLLRIADYYLKTPEGASYPADLDFALGHLILYYSRLEHTSVFSEEDRLILANLLLSCTRSIYEYTLKLWPIKPNAPTRHNHETFPALSLSFAADYFDRYDVPDVDAWRAHAELVFSGGIWSRFKQQENANGYESYPFEHAATYSAFNGDKLDRFEADCLRWVAERAVITTDNFFRPVDYGDASIRMKGGIHDTLATMLTSIREEPVLRWYTGEAFKRQHHYFQLPMGLRVVSEGASPKARTWESLPLDAGFTASYCPGFPQEYAFDKLVFRTGWSEAGHFIMLEGVGNGTVSHSHNELNGITRLNHLGRHWVVSNGYGRRVGVTNVSQSFNTRVRGPEDHNMLVLTREGKVARDLPACNALLQRGQVGDLAYATGGLLGYSGVDWFRALIILADRFVLVIDRIHIRDTGLESGHIEWNCLGKATMQNGGFRLDQQGVFIDVTSDSGWTTALDVADQSADWKRTLESGAYPYAKFPLPKLIFRLPGVAPGESHCLATLLAATHSPESAYRVSEPSPGHVCVQAGEAEFPRLEADDGDLSVRVARSEVTVRFATVPDVPEAIQAWSAKSSPSKRP